MAEDLHVKGKDLKDLKVIELKKELHDRGLATSGNKSDLIARLEEYLNLKTWRSIKTVLLISVRT